MHGEALRSSTVEFEMLHCSLATAERGPGGVYFNAASTREELGMDHMSKYSSETIWEKLRP